MTKRKYTTSRELASGPDGRKLELAKAFKRLFSGNGTQDDADAVLVHLTKFTGYHRRPNYSEWLARTQTPDGFELHSALCNARAEVVQEIIDQLSLDADELMALEISARFEAGR